MATSSHPSVDQFRAFIQLAEPLVLAAPPPSAPPSDEFREFIERSKPLIIEPVRVSLTAVAPRLARIRRWLVSHDLLRIAGFDLDEDPYTELLAWALDPATHPESAVQRQRAWLRRAPFASRIEFTKPATPRTQVETEDGIPDLMLQYERCVVILETKTGTQEHEAPKGSLQTFAYPPAVRTKLGLEETTPVFVVFLTPDGLKAANPEAFNTTFVEFCLALAAALEAFQLFRLPEDLRYAYAMLFTHFLTRAAPPGTDLQSAIQSFNEWEDRLNDTDFLMGRLNEITAAINSLPPEVRA